jgi:hypothetical protein
MTTNRAEMAITQFARQTIRTSQNQLLRDVNGGIIDHE